MMKYLIQTIFIVAVIILPGCGNSGKYVEMVRELDDYISQQSAEIGVAVIIGSKDTVAVNGDSRFPMLSVYKFPQALAVADYCGRNRVGFADTVAIESHELLPDTYSPLRDTYGICDVALPLYELLDYSVTKSDNNACDILFRLIGGPKAVADYLKNIGIDGITVCSTEADMHCDLNLCYANSSTPKAMASLLDRFDTELRHGSGFREVAQLMESCATGGDRLPAPLRSTNAIIGHKTGTGDSNSAGRIIGVNDVGYIHLPDGRRYVIAVFVKDSEYDMNRSAAIIGNISAIVFLHLVGR